MFRRARFLVIDSDKYVYRPLIFLFCNFNFGGRAKTKNRINIYSVDFFLFKGIDYLGVSGDGDFFEVFKISDMKKTVYLGNTYVFIYFY